MQEDRAQEQVGLMRPQRARCGGLLGGVVTVSCCGGYLRAMSALKFTRCCCVASVSSSSAQLNVLSVLYVCLINGNALTALSRSTNRRSIAGTSLAWVT